MAKYGRQASEKVEKAMHERKRGTLTSGARAKQIEPGPSGTPRHRREVGNSE